MDKQNKKIPQLCGKDLCTACHACYNICSKKAIIMVEDQYGELHPQIDDNLCVKCGMCEKVCPELKQNNLHRNGEPKIYACWLKNSEHRKESTSGGAAFAISSAVIRQRGHVWGAAYGKDMYLTYIEANTLEELKAIQKSKYTQCHVEEAFKTIKNELDSGDLVLFTGTGYHVKGLRSFLRKDYPNLMTADLVCHGVPGQGVFRKYKEHLEAKFNDEMLTYIPRPKRNVDGQEGQYYSLAYFKNKGNIKMEKNNNSYFIGFQHNLFLRSACHHCQSNGKERYSDFTLADFWGLGKIAPFIHPYKERTLGVSMLALNSSKALAFFEEFKKDLNYELRSYKEASISNTQYYKSAIPSPYRDEFRNDFFNHSWEELASKYMKFSMKEYILYIIKKFTPPICYYMLNNWRNG